MERPVADGVVRRRGSGRVVLVILAVLLAGAGSTPAQDAEREHPRLVDADGTRCATCHATLLRGLEPIHYPAGDDCTSCHEVATSDEGTRITLVETEPSLCLVCHDGLTASVEGSVETPHFPVTDSCLTCHDPHASGRTALLRSSVGELCTECHDADDVAATHGGQVTPSTDCTRCHQPHGSANARLLSGSRTHPPFAEGSCEACHRSPFGNRIRLRARGESLCEACHGEFEASGPDGSTHPALRGERGRAGCLSCHDPHMSDRPYLALESGAALCGTCHAGIVAAASAESGHPPAADDCTVCHLPHVSEHRRLLNVPPAEICGVCHDLEDDDLRTSHLGADLASLRCLDCHTPHGSGHASLLARNLHPPVADGCDLCHEGSWDRQLEGGESALCLLCHDDIGEAAAKAAVPHPALELARCVDCHNPHASAQEKLVKLPGGGECVQCHEDQAAGSGESAHGVIDLIGCRACHEPHGGSNPRMLRRTGSELCLSCHDPSRAGMHEDEETVTLLERFEIDRKRLDTMATLRLSSDGQRDHPVPGHRVLGNPTEAELKRSGASFEGELTCLTCHDPHKGRSGASLLRWSAAGSSEACGHCHRK